MTIHILDIPETTLTYEGRCNEASNENPLFVIGSAVATGFATLSSHFGDRTVIIDDPGGSERSVLTNPDCPIAPRHNLHSHGRGQPRKPNAA